MESVPAITMAEPSIDKNKTGKKSKKRSADKGGFRKAPGAPKRFKSPYILFSIDRMEIHRKEMGSKTKITSISRLVSDEWKALPEEGRKIWEERAKFDKERYNAEKSLYTGPWQVPCKRSRKDPSAPKRPMSAFLFYSQGKRQELKELNPKLKNTDISRLLGGKWKTASDEDRMPHIKREKKEREVYNRDIAEWRKQKDDEEQAVRKHRHEVAEQWIKSGFQTHGSGVAAKVYAPGIMGPGMIHANYMQLPQQQRGQPTLVPPAPPVPHHGYDVSQMAPTLVPPGADLTFFAPIITAQHYRAAPQGHQKQPAVQATSELVAFVAPSNDAQQSKVPTPTMIPEAPVPLAQPMAAPTTAYPTSPATPMHNYFQESIDASQQPFLIQNIDLQHYYHYAAPQQQHPPGH